MADNPNAEVIAIGTEILLGEITDTNSVFIARALRDIGVNLFFMTTVGDNHGRIASAIDIALDRAEIIITCGGLGPTVDDMTRQGVATATRRDLVFHQELYDTIAERFRGFGVKMTENNRQQAFLPDRAQVIENPVGTAPSFIVETDRGVVISLPGVPREMKYLMTSSVIPYLLKRYQLGVIRARVLRTAGIGESSLDDMIGAELLSQSNPTVGLAAHHGSVDVRITVKAENAESAELLIDEMQKQLELRIGDYIFGKDNDTLEDIVSTFLSEKHLKIAVVEAGIGDAIIRKLDGADVFSSTGEFKSPAEAYEAYGIDHSLQLKDVAIQIAEELQKKDDTVASVVILSHPDIDENADIEQGSAVALSVKGEATRHRIYGFGAKSALAQDWLPRWGLSNLWRMLKDK